MPICTATTKSGAPCAAMTNLRDTPDGLRCFAHDEARREAAQAARARGGKAKGRTRDGGPRVKTVDPSELPGELLTLEDTVRWSSWLAISAATGRIDVNTAREISRALVTLRQSLEKRDLLKRIRDLEKALKAAQQGTP